MRWPIIASLATVVLTGSPAAAQRLPQTVTPVHYDLAFTVDLPGARFDGLETIRVQVPQPTTRIVLNAAEIDFDSVAVTAGGASQSASVTLDAANDQAALDLAQPVPAGDAEIHVRYRGRLNGQLRGFYLSKGPGRNDAVTQFESTDARRAFPCFDEPAYKATFDVTLTIDRGDVAISNGRVISDTPGPGARQHTVKFSTTPRMSTYLVAMAVGDFQCLNGAADGIPIRVCATPDKRDLGQIALESAEHILTFYDRYFAIKYPFQKLDMLAVPDFAAGAMENTAAIFYRETDLLAASSGASLETRKKVATVVAHEMAHQWFGDLVTMKWWDDIWLNEGFATWMETQPVADWKPEWHMDVDQERDTQTALALDSLKSTHPIRVNVSTPTEIDDAFDEISYQKGAAVLRMIEHYVGADALRAGINAYLEAFKYGNATSEDFWNTVTRVSGKPVDQILSTFVAQPGVPLLRASATCSDQTMRVQLAQEPFDIGPGAATGRAWRVPVCIRIGGNSAPLCSVVTGPDLAWTIDDHRCPSWAFVNAGAFGYYRTEYSSGSLAALAPAVATLSAPERLSLIDDQWAMVRAGRASAADYLTLASGFSRESSSGVFAEVSERLAFINEYLSPVPAGFQAFIRATFRPLYESLGPATASDSDDRAALRAAVTSLLGTVGEDPDIAAAARRTVDRALGGGPPLDPTLGGALVQVAAAHGDMSLYDALMSAADRMKSPDDRYRYLNAAADFRDPAIVTRALALALTTAVRTQDTIIYLHGFFENAAARPLAWSFVKENWNALAPKLSIFNGAPRLLDGVGNFCDAASRDDVKTFFASRALAIGQDAVDRMLERIDGCIALRASQSSSVGDWLARR
jgi:aminopeptidase N